MIAGWDIGGVNTKLALVDDGQVRSAVQQPFELQRDPAALIPLLRRLAADAGAGADVTHAVTMTAELSQMFRTKREGVTFVLDAMEQAFPGTPIQVFAVDGRFLAPLAAREEPLAIAAGNWAATARMVAIEHPRALLIDVGSTTADVIPIVGGHVCAIGWDDPSRLASGELVYTGALRTPVEAIVSHVPVRGRRTGVSAEGFALAGDVHVWRGDLAPSDYTVPTPDGRPATREFAGERLARVVCADRELLDEPAIDEIAVAIADAQIARLSCAIEEVLAAHASIDVAVVTGLGAFIAARAASRIGLRIAWLEEQIGPAARCAPAAAVALLLERALDASADRLAPSRGVELAPQTASRPLADVVVKIGGGMLRRPELLDGVLAAVAAGRDQRVLIVPGGGPLADAVRDLDRRFALDDSTSHWMAVLAMDQLAHLIASRLEQSAIVDSPESIAAAFEDDRIPVLAPYRWARARDPLPHSWDVTSDSIAAWVAGALGAPLLVLVKPAGATAESGLADPWFSRTVPPGTSVALVAADDVDRLVTIFAVAGREASP